MNYAKLVEFVRGLSCFDLPLLIQGFEEQRDAIRVQLSRWMQQGKVIGLRRGIYTLPEPYRGAPLVPAALANELYRPSYLSGLWALGYYDMIPERVVWLTSVTPRVPRRFENPFGIFEYRNLKRDYFFGYVTMQIGGRDVVVATPAKALLDHWHLTPGEWTEERLGEMRYQHWERVEPAQLQAFADRCRRPRLRRAAKRWLLLAADDREGTVTL